jgi:hypothetical protein
MSSAAVAPLSSGARDGAGDSKADQNVNEQYVRDITMEWYGRILPGASFRERATGHERVDCA